MKLASLIAVAGLAAVASAQNSLTYSWTVGDTGNNDGFIDVGESAVLTLKGTMAPGKTGFAGSIYDIAGDAEWSAGVVNAYTNMLKALTDDGDKQANNSITGIESFQLPPLFNPNFDASNPVTLYKITWTPSAYAGQTVTVGDTNHLNNDVYTDTFGSSVSYTGVAGKASFNVANVPAPASLALIGLGGLVAGRRRR
ncbi:MAG: PEP-CTERM sorting domain-containing protein [Phycisphaerales bacterium]|nr:PEP-CTERM sorting domain-containing protein [Phycisphaerales bacterium]